MSPRAAPLLTIKQARTLDAVAEHLSLAQAGARLNLSQSSVSRQVVEIETSLGAQLFQRGWFGLEPTLAGAIVAGAARRMTAALNAAQASLKNSGAPVADLGAHLTWDSLNAVEAVRSTGSVSAAAAFLQASQPEISRAVSRVAAATGRPPFRRNRHGMTATADVAVLSALRARLLAEAAALGDALAGLSGAITGRVAVGLLPFSEQDAVVRAFAALMAGHPAIRLQAVTGAYAALVDALRQGELDLILGPLRDPPPFDDLEEVCLLDEHLALIMRRGQPEPDLDALAAMSWVVAPHGTPMRRDFDTFWADAGRAPPVQVCEMITFPLAEAMVASSDAAGLLSYSARKRASLRPDLVALPSPFDTGLRKIGVTRRRDPRANPAEALFIQVLSEDLRSAG